MLIFYINGYAECGKDSFVAFVSNYCDSYSISTIDDVKEICRREFGWDGVKDAKGRKLLAAVKQAWADYNNGPVITVKQHIDTHKDLGAAALFIHVREMQQMLHMQQLYGGETIEVLRTNVQPNLTEDAFVVQQGKYCYDHNIDNNSTLDDLETKAQDFVLNYL